MELITKENSKYFYKSKYWYKITWYTFLWIILYTQVAKVLKTNAIIEALLVVLPIIGMYILVPAGIVYIIKSYVKKEPYNKYRAFYLFGFLFFLFILIAIMIFVAIDINRLSSRP
ncbi:hypothetical protein [Mucilaginibacter pocheonensis]|uniref:Membrane protein YedE/YeeE n=1 Tax=Mucilaginibacter pocheonensis TaxID=398050 RepID=A0ABU1T4N4_9SPHI|nr:hypothetical protein [Mucilaginibacter pocheonensis]MDR6940273.1 putative membrane protein YedE/YeeE [Mucilaginibacter pocheonensis]